MTKERVNVVVDKALVDRARELGINRSQIFQEALASEVGYQMYMLANEEDE